MPALEAGGYSYETHVNIGTRLGGGRHIVDVTAKKGNEKRILVSLKWQQVSGTAEQKIPFEIICLAEAILGDWRNQEKAYLVLGGGGWKLRDFYVGGGLSRHLPLANGLVHVVTLESFVAKANKGRL